MAALRGGDGQVVARAQVERIGRIKLRPRERDIGAAQAKVAGAHRRLAQCVLQVSAQGQTVGLHVDAAGFDVAALMQELPGVDRQGFVGKQVAGIGDAVCRELQVATANHRAIAGQAQRGLCQVHLRHPHRLRAAFRLHRLAHQPDDILLQRRNLLRRQGHARHQMEVLGDFAAVVHQLLILLYRIPALDGRFAGQRQHLLAHQTLLVKPSPRRLWACAGSYPTRSSM